MKTPKSNNTLKKYLAVELYGGQGNFKYALLIDDGRGPDQAELVGWFHKMGDAALVANVMNNHLHSQNFIEKH